MIVIGAGGLAKEILEILKDSYKDSEIFFFDNTSPNSEDYLFQKYRILKTKEEVKQVFNVYGREYCLGLGGVENRTSLYNYFNSLGGDIKTIISKDSFVSKYVKVGKGAMIFPGVKISNGVSIGKCCLIYYNSIITHDCIIGDFVEISPSVCVLGKVKVGNRTFLGANSTILPKVILGNEIIVGAGALVTKPVIDNVMVVGVPARIVEKS